MQHRTIDWLVVIKDDKTGLTLFFGSRVWFCDISAGALMPCHIRVILGVN